MASQFLHKTAGNGRNSSDFLQYMRWEDNQYGFKKAPWHIPSKEKIAYYQDVNDHIRRRLRDVREPDAEKRQQRVDFLYRLLDYNQGRISRERDPNSAPENRHAFGHLPAQAKTQMAAEKGGLAQKMPMLEKNASEGIVRHLLAAHVPPQTECILTGTD
ncbi:MAG: hypothetical protein WCY41_01175 [Candidatus Micrarchaeia archaeon]